MSVGVDMLQKCGLQVTDATSDWGTLLQRRTNKAEPGKGGWNVLIALFSASEFATPAATPATSAAEQLGGRGVGSATATPAPLDTNVPAITPAPRAPTTARCDMNSERGITGSFVRSPIAVVPRAKAKQMRLVTLAD